MRCCTDVSGIGRALTAAAADVWKEVDGMSLGVIGAKAAASEASSSSSGVARRPMNPSAICEEEFRVNFLCSLARGGCLATATDVPACAQSAAQAFRARATSYPSRRAAIRAPPDACVELSCFGP